MTTATTPNPAVAARSAALGRRHGPGLLIVIYGAVQFDGALITAAYRGSSPVPDDRLSYPWDGVAAVTTSVLRGVSQVLFVIGLVAFARSGAVVGRSGRRGAWVAVAGAASTSSPTRPPCCAGTPTWTTAEHLSRCPASASAPS